MSGDWNVAQVVAQLAVGEYHAIQQEDELAELLRRVMGLWPKIIIEIGCDAGGTLYAWRQLCGEVYGITLPVSPPGEGMFAQGVHPLNPHGARVYFGDSHGRDAYLWLTRQLDGRKADFLFIDGDHDPYGVLADFDMYGHLVRPGGVIALDDVVNPDLSVRLAWLTISATHPRTEVIRRGSLPAGIGIVHA